MSERPQAAVPPLAMLRGQRINLRPVREADLDAFYAAHIDVGTRGAFFPLGVGSELKLRAEFAETGFWEREEGTLLIVTPDDEMAGHIEFFKPIN